MIRVTLLIPDGIGWNRVPGVINPASIVSALDVTYSRPNAKPHASSGCVTEVCLSDGRKMLCDASFEVFAAHKSGLEERS